MTRYLIERTWTDYDEEQLGPSGLRSKAIIARMPGLRWEHSHVVMDEQGRIKTLCIYQSPDEDLIREHARLLGGHFIDRIMELGEDIDPKDFPDVKAEDFRENAPTKLGG